MWETVSGQLATAVSNQLVPFKERITEWEPHARLKINIYEFARLPMKDAHADFRLEDLGDGTTKVDMHYTYELSLLGKLMPRKVMQSQLVRGLGGLLKGLDQHVVAKTG